MSNCASNAQVTFRFIVSERDVKRVRMDLERKARASEALSLGSTRRSSLSARDVDWDEDEQAPKGGAGGGGAAGGGRGREAEVRPANSTVINLGKIKKNAQREREEANRRVTETERVLFEGEQYKAAQTTSRSAAFPTYRLPHVAFAALLESELLAIMGSKPSEEFWYLWRPVHAYLAHEALVDYHARIRAPICLMEIREKIGNAALAASTRHCTHVFTLALCYRCRVVSTPSRVARPSTFYPANPRPPPPPPLHLPPPQPRSTTSTTRPSWAT